MISFQFTFSKHRTFQRLAVYENSERRQKFWITKNRYRLLQKIRYLNFGSYKGYFSIKLTEYFVQNLLRK